MDTMTMSDTVEATFVIWNNTSGPGFVVTRNGVFLTDRNNQVRTFTTRSSARKRIARERSGNFHK